MLVIAHSYLLITQEDFGQIEPVNEMMDSESNTKVRNVVFPIQLLLLETSTMKKMYACLSGQELIVLLLMEVFCVVLIFKKYQPRSTVEQLYTLSSRVNMNSHYGWHINGSSLWVVSRSSLLWTCQEHQRL